MISALWHALKALLSPIGITTIDVSDLPPTVTDEDYAALVALHRALAEAPTATDDYRDPPPPDLSPQGAPA